MSRLIDADALEREGWSLCRTSQKDKSTMVYEVKKPSDFPTIEERKKGKWRRLPMACYGGGTVIEYQCPFCGEQFIMPSNYCQECGADMRGGDGGSNDKK